MHWDFPIFSLLGLGFGQKSGWEMGFGQNLGWEMGFIPPLQDPLITPIIVLFSVSKGMNMLSELKTKSCAGCQAREKRPWCQTRENMEPVLSAGKRAQVNTGLVFFLFLNG